MGELRASLKRRVRAARFRLRIQRQSSQPLDPGAMAPPILVAAIGGSGTRAVVELLEESGIFMGSEVDRRTRDSLPLRWFLNRHFDALVTAPEAPSAACERDFHRALRVHRAAIPHAQEPWGWKNPRWMWLLPFLAPRFPGMRFVHLVRDGRDMALSRNRVLLRVNGDALLGADRTGHVVDDQFRLWCRGNLRATHDLDRLPGVTGIHVRFEDLCANPTKQLERLVEFLERPLAPEVVGRIARSIRPPESLGRGRRSDCPTLREPDPEDRKVLERFGYAN